MSANNHPLVTEDLAELEPGLTFPILMDTSGESMRVYGDPRPLYPRNVVIGRDGTVVHTDNEFNLDAAQAAIEAALEE